MKKIVLILLIFPISLILLANVNALKSQLTDPDIFYQYKIKILDTLDVKNKNMLNFLEKFIFNAKTTNMNTDKMYILPHAYKAFSRLTISSKKRWNNIEYIFEQLRKTVEDKSDQRALKSKMIYRWGLQYHLYDMVSNDNFSIFTEQYKNLDLSSKKLLIRALSMKVSTPKIMPFYLDILLNGTTNEKNKIIHGISENKSPESLNVLLKYLKEHPENIDLNSSIVYMLVRKGICDKTFYSLLDKFYSKGNEIEKRRVLRSALIIANKRVEKYLKVALKNISFKTDAKKALEKIRKEGNK